MDSSREVLDGDNSDGYIVVRKKEVEKAAAAAGPRKSGRSENLLFLKPGTVNLSTPLAGMHMSVTPASLDSLPCKSMPVMPQDT